MAELRELAVALGLGDPRTLLNSGNLVVSSRLAAGKLESVLETETKKRLGVETRFLVRAADDWHSAIDANPFPDAARSDPARLAVMFLRDAASAKAVESLQRAIVGRETIRSVGKHAYIIYPDGMGQSKLTLPMIEKALGTTATGRNWNTVVKIGAMLSD
jgi:uncharacterized protein (DUF1697 family)